MYAANLKSRFARLSVSPPWSVYYRYRLSNHISKYTSFIATIHSMYFNILNQISYTPVLWNKRVCQASVMMRYLNVFYFLQTNGLCALIQLINLPMPSLGLMFSIGIKIACPLVVLQEMTMYTSSWINFICCYVTQMLGLHICRFA